MKRQSRVGANRCLGWPCPCISSVLFNCLWSIKNHARDHGKGAVHHNVRTKGSVCLHPSPWRPLKKRLKNWDWSYKIWASKTNVWQEGEVITMTEAYACCDNKLCDKVLKPLKTRKWGLEYGIPPKTSSLQLGAGCSNLRIVSPSARRCFYWGIGLHILQIIWIRIMSAVQCQSQLELVLNNPIQFFFTQITSTEVYLSLHKDVNRNLG